MHRRDVQHSDGSDNGPLARLAGLVGRRPRTVVAVWIAIVVGAFALAFVASGEWSTDYSTPGSGSKAAAQLLGERFDRASVDTVDLVWRAEAGAGDAAVTARVEKLIRAAEGLPGVEDGARTTTAGVSEDGTTAVLQLQLERRSEEIPDATGSQLVAFARDASRPGLQVAVGGSLITRAESGGLPGETIGLAIATLILLVSLGTLVAAGLPLMAALTGVAVGSALVAVLAVAVDVPDWGLSVAIMIGLGVGIDYALLIITRHRSALAEGATVPAALRQAMGYAGHSVIVAGTTVVLSLLGLFLMGLPYLQGVALATVLAVVIVMLAALTLLPAVLTLVGHRIERLRIPGLRVDPSGRESRLARRWANLVGAHPWRAAATGIAIIVVLAAPAFGMRLGFPDAGNSAPEAMDRQAYELIARGFGPGANGPLLVVAELGADGSAGALARLRQAIDGDTQVRSVAGPVVNAAADTAVLTVIPTGAPQDATTSQLIGRIRNELIPAAAPAGEIRIVVGGATAATVDQSAVTGERLPLFVGSVVLLSTLLLMASFRAVPVAVKAAVLTLLSVGAAYGVIALLARGGWAGGLVGIDAQTPVPPFIPVMLFAVLFGLSMDYEVFLVSRIRESWLAGRSAGDAVGDAIAGTSRVITTAAAIMVVVFGSFVLGDDVGLKLIGAGLAAAVLIDATVVRLLLVPSVMHLLGDRAWWFPGRSVRSAPIPRRSDTEVALGSEAAD